MKKTWYALVLILFVISAAGSAFAGTVTVRQKMAKVRTQPKFYAPEVATVQRGEWLEEISRSGQWLKVQTPAGAQGWVHSSACVLKKLKLSTAESMGAGNVSADEVALAGKGFNPVVERKYREAHPELNYRLLDQIESYDVDEAEIIRFMQEGKLGEFRGAK
jgi:uncharacterized protein YgiM (DUF1202 family)